MLIDQMEWMIKTIIVFSVLNLHYENTSSLSHYANSEDYSLPFMHQISVIHFIIIFAFSRLELSKTTLSADLLEVFHSCRCGWLHGSEGLHLFRVNPTAEGFMVVRK